MQPKKFQDEVLTWYDANGRDLPWRKTRDPYKILLSEVMLQQTQVPRVIIKWQEWLQKFPSASAVANASTRDVLLAWQGMGYNSRALRLKECCNIVSQQGWPQTPEGLDELPGIGRYTAHAIACFAFNQRVPLVDVNVKLVYAPFVGSDADDEKVWQFAHDILPQKRFYDYNQALFDVGTVVKSGDLSTLPPQVRKLYENIKTVPKKSAEKLYKGVPMRLYRGAIVQCLRESKKHEASLQQLANYCAAKLAEQPVSFFMDVAKKLQKDGLVILERDRVRLI